MCAFQLSQNTSNSTENIVEYNEKFTLWKCTSMQFVNRTHDTAYSSANQKVEVSTQLVYVCAIVWTEVDYLHSELTRYAFVFPLGMYVMTSKVFLFDCFFF